MRYILLAVAISLMFIAAPAYCQDAQDILSKIDKISAETVAPSAQGQGLIAGFSMAGLIAGILFSGIGFVAFVYGKKNSEFKPLLLGIILMVYPYFVRNTITMCLVGVVLTVLLFVWRE